MKLKYIIEKYKNNQIGGSFSVPGSKIKLILHVTELKAIFYDILRHFNASDGTEIQLSSDTAIDGDKLPINWKWNESTKILTKISDSDIAKNLRMYYIWDLIDAVRSDITAYNLNFETRSDYENVFAVSDMNKLQKILYNDKFFGDICRMKNINIHVDHQIQNGIFSFLRTEQNYSSDEIEFNRLLYQCAKFIHIVNEEDLDIETSRKEIENILNLKTITKISGSTPSGISSKYFQLQSTSQIKTIFGYIISKNLTQWELDKNELSKIMEYFNLISRMSELRLSPELHTDNPFFIICNKTYKYRICVVTEHYEYNLNNYLIKEDNSPTILKKIKDEIHRILDDLLKMNIIWIDIKPSNMVINIDNENIDLRFIDWDLDWTCSEATSTSDIIEICYNLSKLPKNNKIRKYLKYSLLFYFRYRCDDSNRSRFNDGINENYLNKYFSFKKELGELLFFLNKDTTEATSFVSTYLNKIFFNISSDKKTKSEYIQTLKKYTNP